MHSLQIPSVLKEAQSVGLMTAYHNYLITNLVSFTFYFFYSFGVLLGSNFPYIL